MSSLPWIALAVLAALLISGSHILAVFALRRLSLPAFLGLRALAGLAFCLPWLPRLADLRLDAPGWILFAASLLLSPFLLGVLYFSGLAAGRLAAQGGLRQISPGMIALWQWGVLGAATSARDWLGVAFTLGGAVLIIADHPPGPRAAIWFGLAAATTQAAALLVQSALLPQLDPVALIAAQNAGFAVLTATWFYLARRTPAPNACASAPATPPPSCAVTPSLRLAITLALLSGLIVQVLFDRIKFALIPQLGVFPTACLLLLQLPFFALLARLCFHEPVSRRQTLSLALIFTGALLGAR